MVRWPTAVAFKPHLGIDVVDATLLYLQSAIVMGEPSERFVGLELSDF